MSCNCLGFINNEPYWEAVGNWMVDFGQMNRNDQQRVIIEKIRHADSLAENFNAASQDSKSILSYAFLSSWQPNQMMPLKVPD